MTTDLHIAACRPGPKQAQSSEKQAKNGLADFGKAIKGALEKVDLAQKEGNRSIAALLRGEASVTETMVATQKADISMRLMLTVRNKAIEAYKEIMRMQF